MGIIETYYLIASSFAVTLYSLCYKWAKRKGASGLGVTRLMLLVSLPMVLVLFRGSLRGVPSSLYFLAVLGGTSLAISVITFFIVMQRARLSIAWTVIALAVAMPTLASIFYWGEALKAAHVAGLAGIGVAILLFSLGKIALEKRNSLTPGQGSDKGGVALMLFISFLTTGITMTTMKAVVEENLEEHRALFLLLLYAVAALVGWLLPSRHPIRPRGKDFIVALPMAFFGVLSIYYLLRGLSLVEGAVFYPARSALNITATTILSVLIFKEKLHSFEIAGMALAIASIFLLQS